MPHPSDPAPAPERKLEGWGEIALYLRREIRTVQRWEKTLGLPIHRLSVGKQASVYAYPSELDRWYREREPKIKAEEIQHAKDSGAGAPEAKNADTPAPALTSPEPLKHSSDRRLYWVAGFAAVLFMVFLISRFEFNIPIFKPAAAVQPSAKLRLFVRPFQTGDTTQIEFTDGLTSEINNRLGRLDPQRLGVIAPTSSKQLGGKPISELEPLLKLNYVLEGSVRRASNQVRIDISLISAKDQTPVWSDSYTENQTDILKVQDEVADAVAQKLLLHLPKSSDGAPPVDPDGYAFYLRGRRAWAVRDLARSVPAFEAAVQRLPNFVPAHAGLASAYALLSQAPNDAVPQSFSVPRAKAEVQRALALDPSNAEAHYVRGNILMYYDWDFPAAEAELREAIRIDANSPTAHQWLGQYFMTQNRLADARAETQKALDLDPVSPIFTTALAETSYYEHDFGDTIAKANLTLEQSPHFLLAEYWLGSAYREKKMYPEAIQHFRAASNLVPGNPALLTVLAHSLALSGDRQGATSILNQLRTMAHQRYVPAMYLAAISIGLGDKNSAFDELDRAVAEHDDRMIYLAVEPMADPLRSDPRFQALLARLHLDRLSHQ